MKGSPISLVIREIQTKTIWNATSYPLGWLQFKNNCVGKCAKKWNPHTLLLEMSNCAATVEKAWQFLKVKHRVIIWPSNSTTTYTPKRIEEKFSNKNLYKNVHSSIIHMSQKVETTQQPSDWWMGKQNGARPCNGVLFIPKEEWSSDACHDVVNLENFTLSEPIDTKRPHIVWFLLL